SLFKAVQTGTVLMDNASTSHSHEDDASTSLADAPPPPPLRKLGTNQACCNNRKERVIPWLRASCLSCRSRC
ncbi:hypothetical protein BT69DRAFT_1275296, partial [Atractiella rhizophila]